MIGGHEYSWGWSSWQGAALGLCFNWLGLRVGLTECYSTVHRWWTFHLMHISIGGMLEAWSPWVEVPCLQRDLRSGPVYGHRTANC